MSASPLLHALHAYFKKEDLQNVASASLGEQRSLI